MDSVALPAHALTTGDDFSALFNSSVSIDCSWGSGATPGPPVEVECSGELTAIDEDSVENIDLIITFKLHRNYNEQRFNWVLGDYTLNTSGTELVRVTSTNVTTNEFGQWQTIFSNWTTFNNDLPTQTFGTNPDTVQTDSFGYFIGHVNNSSGDIQTYVNFSYRQEICVSAAISPNIVEASAEETTMTITCT